MHATKQEGTETHQHELNSCYSTRHRAALVSKLTHCLVILSLPHISVSLFWLITPLFILFKMKKKKTQTC